ncbi:MAG TPA: PQQ-binding-like beta-propeller repeat protein [Chthoniobacterales bacterium]|jgi:outer membrane protein assembly factor BamB
MNDRKLKRLALGCALVVSFLAPAAEGQWMFRGDPAHSGVYTGKAPREFHRLKWKFPTGDQIVSSPVLANGIIYFAGDDGNIYAVNADTGTQIWKYPTGGPVPATPAVSDGTVYAGSYDGKFYALDAKTGLTKWKFATEGERRFEAKGLNGLQPKNQTMADPFDVYLSSPVVVKNIVYFGSGDGNLYAVDTGSGELKWKFKTGDVVHASPAYSDGMIYLGSWDSYFYAVDAVTGKERWRFHGGEDPLIHNQVGFQSSPVVAGGVVYTGCRDSNVYALDAATGKEKWKFFNEMSWVNTAPALNQGKLFFATSDSSLFHVVDAATGKSVNRQQGKAFMFSSPAVAGDVVFIGVLNGTLEARDINSGELLWDYQVEKSKQNKGWVLTADRKFNEPLLSYSQWREAPTVATERQFGIGAIFSSPLVANGIVYFGSTDGYLYALE